MRDGMVGIGDRSGEKVRPQSRPSLALRPWLDNFPPLPDRAERVLTAAEPVRGQNGSG